MFGSPALYALEQFQVLDKTSVPDTRAIFNYCSYVGNDQEDHKPWGATYSGFHEALCKATLPAFLVTVQTWSWNFTWESTKTPTSVEDLTTGMERPLGSRMVGKGGQMVSRSKGLHTSQCSCTDPKRLQWYTAHLCHIELYHMRLRQDMTC